MPRPRVMIARRVNPGLRKSERSAKRSEDKNIKDRWSYPRDEGG
jgi:hypothetical protein